MVGPSKSAAPVAVCDPQKAHGFSWYGGVLLLLLTMYVLSIGPAERFYAQRTPPAPVIAFYEPLNWLSRTFQPARHFLGWYVYGVWVRPRADH